MSYAEQKIAIDNRRFSRIRNLTFGQRMALVGGVFAVLLGAYFLFSVL
jgi:hypothetical protein